MTAAGYLFDEWDSMRAVLEARELGAAWRETLIERGGLRILAPFYYGTRNLTTTRSRCAPRPISRA